MITLDSLAPAWAVALVRQINQAFAAIRPSNAVKITGGTIDGTEIGGATPAAVAATTLTLGGGTLLSTSAALTNNSGAATGTLTNAPTSGNPTKWIKIDDNGVIRSIPCW